MIYVMNSCLAEIPVDQVKILLALVSLGIAVVTILLLRHYDWSRKGKVSLMYSHLSSLFFPPVLFTTNAACGLFCLPCFENPLGIALLALPTTLGFSALAGFIIIPAYYYIARTRVTRGPLPTFLSAQSALLALKTPALYLIHSAKPIAYSFKSITSGIVLSVGLLDILNKKEQEAVLLHELYHIAHRASVFKFSTLLMRFSPFSFLKNFNEELTQEEHAADQFVVTRQHTSRHLSSAKAKVTAYQTTDTYLNQKVL